MEHSSDVFFNLLFNITNGVQNDFFFLSTVHLLVENTIKIVLTILQPQKLGASPPHFYSCHRLATLQALLLIKKIHNKTWCAPVSHMHESIPSDRNIPLPLINTPPYCPAITCPIAPLLIFNTTLRATALQNWKCPIVKSALNSY